MAFQPFGYRFDIRSPLGLDGAKSRLRRKTKGWFDPASGPRGWIVGPFFCLWSSAWNSQGPMVIGRLAQDNLGVRITGRAGSDLNGVIWCTALASGIGVAFLLSGASLSQEDLPWLVVVILGFTLVLGFAHKDRVEAEGLVRFLEDQLSPLPDRPRPKVDPPLLKEHLVMDVNAATYGGKIDAEAVRDALVSLQSDEFLILSSSDQQFMQTLREGDYFIIEKCEGSADRHVSGQRKATGEAREYAKFLFTRDEVLEALWAYGAADAEPDFLDWGPLRN